MTRSRRQRLAGGVSWTIAHGSGSALLFSGVVGWCVGRLRYRKKFVPLRSALGNGRGVFRGVAQPG